MEEIAYALYKKHGIVTDTIGGFAGPSSETQQKLKNTADAGGGSFTAAVDYDTVRDAIVQSAVETSKTVDFYSTCHSRQLIQ